MEINETTATSLGEKLAGLDLTDAEGALLSALLAPEDEVSGYKYEPQKPDGFAFNFEKVKFEYAPVVHKPVAESWSWGISQT